MKLTSVCSLWLFLLTSVGHAFEINTSKFPVDITKEVSSSVPGAILPMVVPPPPMPGVNIIWLEAWFYTWGDDKDRDLGINEKFLNGTTLLGEASNHHKGLVFRQGYVNQGKKYEVAVPFDECRNIRYEYSSSNDDGWEVRFEIRAGTSDGKTHILGGTANTKVGNGKPRSLTINLCR